MGSLFVLSMWRHNVVLTVFDKGFKGKIGRFELENIDMIATSDHMWFGSSSMYPSVHPRVCDYVQFGSGGLMVLPFTVAMLWSHHLNSVWALLFKDVIVSYLILYREDWRDFMSCICNRLTCKGACQMAGQAVSNVPIGLPLRKLMEWHFISVVFELWINSCDCEWDLTSVLYVDWVGSRTYMYPLQKV